METKLIVTHENDVLCGRGGSINNHPGNEKYRHFVNRKKRIYLTARFKREKRLIAASIVQEIRNQEPPGRFLAKDGRSGEWYDIGDLKARDKTSQALREGAPEIRKEMENDRQKELIELQKQHQEQEKQKQQEQQDQQQKQALALQKNVEDEKSQNQVKEAVTETTKTSDTSDTSGSINNSTDPTENNSNNNDGSNSDAVISGMTVVHHNVVDSPMSHSPLATESPEQIVSEVEKELNDNKIPYSPFRDEADSYEGNMNAYSPAQPHNHEPSSINHNKVRFKAAHSSPSQYETPTWSNTSMPDPSLSAPQHPHSHMPPPPPQVPQHHHKHHLPLQQQRAQFRQQQQQHQQHQRYYPPEDNRIHNYPGHHPHSHHHPQMPPHPHHHPQTTNPPMGATSSYSSYAPQYTNGNGHSQYQESHWTPESRQSPGVHAHESSKRYVDPNLSPIGTSPMHGSRHQSFSHHPNSSRSSNHRHRSRGSSRKQIVESNAQQGDWFCSNLLPSDIMPNMGNLFGKSSQGGQDDQSTDGASFCGMDLCSIGSLGGASLCQVFLEDDPSKQTNTEIEIAQKNQVLKEAKSWGSVRSKSTLGSNMSNALSFSSADNPGGEMEGLSYGQQQQNNIMMNPHLSSNQPQMHHPHTHHQHQYSSHQPQHQAQAHPQYHYQAQQPQQHQNLSSIPTHSTIESWN